MVGPTARPPPPLFVQLLVLQLGHALQTYVIYDHLDVILHPIAFHLTEALAMAAWVRGTAGGEHSQREPRRRSPLRPVRGGERLADGPTPAAAPRFSARPGGL